MVKNNDSASNHSLDKLRQYHGEASNFFAAQLMMLSEVIPKIKTERIAKAAVLLMSCGQTGEAILHLSSRPDTFSMQSAMLARAFMETITNFCYVCICDDLEFRAFTLHPVYKNYHNAGFPKFEDGGDYVKNLSLRKKKQQELKKIPIVQEALNMFSETKGYLSWSKKKLHERIDAISKWGKVMDVFFFINKIQYYADASEALHGSLYGCTYKFGFFDNDVHLSREGDLEKKLTKDNACILLHLGILIHESFTLISYSDDIEEIFNHSYENRTRALNLLFHILGKDITEAAWQP